MAGFICGFVVSIPIGPVNVTVINTALRKGFVAAFLVGLGAIAAEVLYAALALAGHTSIFDKPQVKFALHSIALVAIAGLGVRYLLTRPEKLESSVAKAEAVDERWHHPRALVLGFILTISNVLLILVWASLGAVLFEHEWVTPQLRSRAICLTGVLAGGATWFFLLAFFVSRAHRWIKPATLTILMRGCGVVFLGFAALLAWKLFRA